MLSRVLRLQSSFSCIPDEEGRLAVISTVLQRRLVLGGDPTTVGRAMSILADGVDEGSYADVIAQGSGLTLESVRKLVTELDRAGVLVHRERQDDVVALDGKGLYDRQARFLSLFETKAESGFSFNRKLQERRVVIPGIGGTGGWLALLCARMGIRDIVVIDADTVELSNLHRQVLYGKRNIGQKKVQACLDQLEGIDEEVTVTGHAVWVEHAEQIAPLLEGADLVINSWPPFDGNFSVASDAVSAAALIANVPCLQMPAAHCIGPLTIPGESACYLCAREVLRSEFGTATQILPSWWKRGYIGAISPRQAITGGLAMWEVVRFLSGMDRPPTLDGTVRLDIASYTKHTFIPLSRNPDCVACGCLSRDEV